MLLSKIPTTRAIRSAVVPLLLAAACHAAPADAENNVAQRRWRKLAPGVETTIPVNAGEDETHDSHNVVEVTVGNPRQWKPSYPPGAETLLEKATNVNFRRGIWQLEFTFKPLRLVRVDVPVPGDRMESKLIWYMVYRVRNLGDHLNPVEVPQDKLPGDEWGRRDEQNPGAYKIDKVDSAGDLLAPIWKGEVRFVPVFTLEVLETGKRHTDQIIPVAKREIFLRERPACPYEQFYNTVEISGRPIPVGKGRDARSVWGFVTWSDIDPTTDYVSIYIKGLSNAYLWQDPAGGYKPGDPAGTGRKFVWKTLQLNFSRPGDEFRQRQAEIQLGIPGKPGWDWVFMP